MERIGFGGGDSTAAALAGAGGIGIVQALAVVPAIMYIDSIGELSEADSEFVSLL